MNRLEGKAAIITGGCSGIGEGIVRLFAEEGASVAIFDIKEGPILQEIRDAGRKCYFEKLSIGDEKSLQNAIKNVFDEFGHIDILINNAGIPGANKPTHAITESEWDEVFDIDVKGTFFATKHVIPYMVQNGGGSIVNLSSCYASHGSMGDISIYHAAKGAVLAMTKQDAATYGRKGIRVNAILPGTIATPLLEKLTEKLEGGFDAYAAYIAKRNPLNKIGEPKDVAYGALYLASDESKFVTGASLYIDGGYTCW